MRERQREREREREREETLIKLFNNGAKTEIQ